MLKEKEFGLGPPFGAASATSERILKLHTDMSREKIMKELNWLAQGGQAFSDKKVDVYTRPAPAGAPIVQIIWK